MSELLTPELLGLILSILFASFSYLYYRNISKDTSYSFARLFLERGALRALTTLNIGFGLYMIARITSFLIVMGFLEEAAIYSIRAPIDLLAGILLIYSIMNLWRITRRR
ncbi:hypothetical protein DRO64_11695 [Candidatus Bathyarchaeota archaeon]|nr:MAG: hypothetical protein DRO64_11695 [Candidatus Bathyarchaeota archaeon]